MKYYKIYSQCVLNPKHVIPITKDQALAILDDELFNNSDYGYNVEWNWEHEDPNDEDSDITQECIEAFYSHVYERLCELLEEKGYVDCGDYRIVKLEDDEEPTIQNACGISMATWI